MKTVDRLLKKYADRLEPVDATHGCIWNEGADGWWASLKLDWKCSATECSSCHEPTLRGLELALRNARQITN